MKYLFLLSLLFTVVSCEEEVPAWDKLDAQERANIRSRNSQKCLTNAESGIKQHAKNAREKMLGMERKHYWNLETGLSTDSTKDKSNIYVWKRTGEAVYFVYRDEKEKVIFIKMTASFNERMLRDLMEKNCTEDSADNVVVTTSSSAASILIKDRSFSSHPKYYKLDTTFKTESKYPIFFLKYLFEQKKKELKESGSSTVVKTETIVGKVESSGNDYNELPSTYDPGFSDPEFCIPKFTVDADNTGEIDLVISQTEGIELNCTDSVAGPANPDAATFPDMNFVPTNEL